MFIHVSTLIPDENRAQLFDQTFAQSFDESGAQNLDDCYRQKICIPIHVVVAASTLLDTIDIKYQCFRRSDNDVGITSSMGD